MTIEGRTGSHLYGPLNWRLIDKMIYWLSYLFVFIFRHVNPILKGEGMLWKFSRIRSRKKSRPLIFIFTFCTWLCSPLATNMGAHGLAWARMDPYGLVYHYISLFYMIYTLCLHCFHMILYCFLRECWDIHSQSLKTIFTHLFTFLEKSKDHFSSPPDPKFASKCKIIFPTCLYLHENPLLLVS